MKIKLNKDFIFSRKNRPLIIAEISGNHCGNKKLFLKHILEAKKSGADLVKIQTYEPEDLLVNKKVNLKKLVKGTWKGKSLWQLYQQSCTPFSWHEDAFKLAKKNNIVLFSTPFSIRALKFLKKFNPPIYKISSFEITDYELIKNIAQTKKPIILSTGMSSINEIEKAIKIIRRYNKKIILMYCVSGYPTPSKDSNIKNIKFFKSKYKNCLIGLSDHTNDIWSSIAATAHGVVAIEKHFIISKKINSNDSLFSIDPKKMKELRTLSEEIFNVNGSINMNLKYSENNSLIFRRSIFAIKDIKKNEKLTKKNTGVFRPNLGIPASDYYKSLNKKVKKNISKFEPIFNKDIFN